MDQNNLNDNDDKMEETEIHCFSDILNNSNGDDNNTGTKKIKVVYIF